MSREHTIGRWLADRARATPDRAAIRFLGGELSYGELDRRTSRLAAGLKARGLRRGDRLATLTGTSPDHVATLFACARLGVCLQPVSWRLAAPEIAYQLEDAEPSLLLAAAEHEELARAAGVAVEVARIGDPTLEADGEVEEVAEDDDPLLVVYTSGTTGRPKGALLTHANCFWTNLSFDRVGGVREDDVVLGVLPQFHAGGWNVQPLLAWWKGATVVLEPSFEPERALRLIAEQRVTTMMGVPATYHFLAQESGFAEADLTSLRLAVVGGAPMPEALLETWHGRGVEAALQHDGAALPPREQRLHVPAAAVELRQHLQDDVVACQPGGEVEREVRPEAVRVREHGALRPAGRAGRVDEQQPVVVRHVDVGRIGDVVRRGERLERPAGRFRE